MKRNLLCMGVLASLLFSSSTVEAGEGAFLFQYAMNKIGEKFTVYNTYTTDTTFPDFPTSILHLNVIGISPGATLTINGPNSHLVMESGTALIFGLSRGYSGQINTRDLHSLRFSDGSIVGIFANYDVETGVYPLINGPFEGYINAPVEAAANARLNEVLDTNGVQYKQLFLYGPPGVTGSINVDPHRALFAIIYNANKGAGAAGVAIDQFQATQLPLVVNGNIVSMYWAGLKATTTTTTTSSPRSSLVQRPPKSIGQLTHQFMRASRKYKESKYQHSLAWLKTAGTADDSLIDMRRVINEGQLPATQFYNTTMSSRVWMTGLYSHYNNRLDNMSTTADSRGIQVGVDTTKTGLPMGISVAYTTTTPRFNGRNSGNSKAYQTNIYGGYEMGKFNTMGSLGYVHTRNHMRLGSHQKYKTNGMNAFLLGSYAQQLSIDNLLEPMVSVMYGRTWTPSVDQYIGNTVVAKTKAHQNNALLSDIGFRITHFFEKDEKEPLPLKAYAQVLWQHNYKEKQSAGTTLVTGTGALVNNVSQRQAKDSLDFGTGLVVNQNDIDIFVSYNGSFARKVKSHAGMAGIRVQL